MILAFGKHAPTDSSHHAKKFGLLPLVVSVAVALGLAALGPDTVAWFGLVGRQGSGASPLDSNGTTQDRRDISSTEVDLSSNALLGSAKHGLRHLNNGKTGWNAGTCTCTGSANNGGFDYIELHFSGDASDLGDTSDSSSNISSFKQNLEVVSSKQGGTTIYPDPDGEWQTSATWTDDDYDHYVLKFEFPPDVKKITETSFHICFASGATVGTCIVSSGDTQCYYLGDGCYEWKLHTSCSVLPLIGEQLWFGPTAGSPIDQSPIVVEVVEWADREGHVCRPCGNGELNAGEECENPNGDGPKLYPNGLWEGCTKECVCDRTNSMGTGFWFPDPENEGHCKEELCGNGSIDIDDGEECDDGDDNGAESSACESDCTCKGDLLFDPTASPGLTCTVKTCEAPLIPCEVEGSSPECKCGTCGGPTCTATETCCSGTCVNAADCNPNIVCPGDMGPIPVSPGTASNTINWVVTATDSFNNPIPPEQIQCMADANQDGTDEVVVSGSTLFPVGQTKVTCTAIDPNDDSLKDTCSFFVTVEDNEPPETNCPANMAATVNDGESYATGLAWEATAVDHGSNTNYSSDDGSMKCYADLDVNGDGTATSVRVFSSTYTGTDPATPNPTLWPVGVTVVTCTAIDPHVPALDEDCTFSVTVEDDEPPETNCPANMAATVNDGESYATGLAWEATAVDHGSNTNYSSDDGSMKCYADLDVNGDGTATSVRVFSSTYTGTDPATPNPTLWPVGVTVVTCTAIDPHVPALDEDCTFSVTVEDDEPPETNCPANMAATVNDGESYATGLAWEATAVDHGSNTNYSSDDGSMECYADLDVNGDGTATSVRVFSSTYTGTDPATPNPTLWPVGVTVVTCTAIDPHVPALDEDCTFSVTVEDDEPPETNCPANMAATVNDGESYATGLAWEATAVDHGSNTNYSSDDGSMECYADLDVNGDGTATSVRVFSSTYTGTDPATPNPTLWPVGVTVVTCTAIDPHVPALDEDCTFSVTVEDDEPPETNCPANMAATVNDGESYATGLAWEATAVDHGSNTNYSSDDGSMECYADLDVNGDGTATSVRVFSSTYTGTDPATPNPTLWPVGVTVVTCTAIDPHVPALDEDCTFSVTVEDDEPPETNCPANMAATVNDGESYATGLAWEATAVDHGSNTNYSSDDGSMECYADLDVNGDGTATSVRVFSSTYTGTDPATPNPTLWPVGVTVVTCTAIDPHVPALDEDCTFSVTVEDDEPPETNCPANMAATVNDGESYATGLAWEATAVDHGSNTNYSSDDGSMECYADLDVNGDGTATSVRVFSSTYTGTDPATPNPTLWPVGVTVVTCTAIDPHVPALDEDCTFSVTVEDDEPPETNCPANMAATVNDGESYATGLAWEATAVDHGSNTNYSSDDGSMECYADLDVNGDGTATSVRVFSSTYTGTDPATPNPTLWPVGVTVVTCTAIDPHVPALDEDCTFSVTVEDDEPPETNCPANIHEFVAFSSSVVSVHFEATAVDHGSNTNYSSDDGSMECYADLDGDVDTPDVQVFSSSYDALNPQVIVSTKFPVGISTVICKAIDPNNAILVGRCSFDVVVTPKCGNGFLDGAPFNEQCDSSPHCDDKCTCCSLPDLSCPLELQDPIHWSCEDGMSIKPASNYTDDIKGHTSCTDGGAEETIDSEVSCSYFHPTADSTKIRRTWTVTIEGPCADTKTCHQDIYINCPPADKNSRRLLHSILSEDEVSDWKPTSSSLRSLQPFIKSPKTRG